jgi:O-acetyl-ADP-ribose deacetylase (regulator of RNase III)
MSTHGASGTEREAEYALGDAVFRVVYSDITAIRADALVSSDDNHLTMGGGVSMDLLEAGGAGIRQDARKHVPMRQGEVAVTTAGSLPAKYVFHCAVIDLEQYVLPDAATIRNVTDRCLRLADCLSLHHIAFPALGTGTGQVPAELAAETMVRTISDYLIGTTSLHSVTVALLRRESVAEDVLNVFYERAIGIASLSTQSRRLGQLIEELERLAAGSRQPELRDRLEGLRRDIRNAERDLAQSPLDAQRMETMERSASLDSLGARVVDVSDQAQSSLQWEDRQSETQLLRTRLEGISAVLNTNYKTLNELEIERAKYGGRGVPIGLQNQISDVEAEIQRVAALRQETQRQIVELATRES